MDFLAPIIRQCAIVRVELIEQHWGHVEKELAHCKASLATQSECVSHYLNNLGTSQHFVRTITQPYAHFLAHTWTRSNTSQHDSITHFYSQVPNLSSPSKSKPFQMPYNIISSAQTLPCMLPPTIPQYGPMKWTQVSMRLLLGPCH